MSCKKFIIECQENLQRLINSVGIKTEENREFEQLLQELLQLCNDNMWPYHDIIAKAIPLARNNKFIDAAFCYRVFLQDHKFSDLKFLNTYLKCVFLAENTKKYEFSHEIIFESIEQLIEYKSICLL